MIRALHNRIMMMIARGIARRINDDPGLQLVQLDLQAGETREKVERIQDYGFTSVPLPGAEAAAAFVAGNRAHGLIVGIDDRRYRLTGLQGGEVALYTDEGDKIHFKRGNNIEITTNTLTVNAGKKVRINSPQVEATGDIIDNVESNSNTLSNMRSIFNSHTHTGDSGGTTSDPNSTQ